MKLIILDRDGVINYESDAYIKSPDEWIPIPQSLDAIARLNRAGYTVVIATNQAGIGRGLYDVTALNAIHEKMQQTLRRVGGYIDKIFYCPHHPDAHCSCRKPKTGLFKQIAEAYAVSLKNVPMIGDSWRDISAAKAMHCQSLLVQTGNGKTTIRDYSFLLKEVSIFTDLFDAVNSLIK